jgi:WD40 repeat protein
MAFLDQSGSTLAVNSGGAISMLDFVTGKERHRLTNNPPTYSFALSQDGRFCAGWPYAGDRLRIWDVAKGRLMADLPVNHVYAAAFSPDGGRLVTVDIGDCLVRETSSGRLLYSFKRPGVGSFIPRATFAPDGRMEAITYSTTDVRLFETATGRELATLEPPEPSQITWLTFSSDGGRLAVATNMGMIQLWDLRLIRDQLATMKLDWELPPYPPPTSKAEGSKKLTVTVLEPGRGASTP